MKEKKYHLQEDHGAAFAEEPTPAYHGNTSVVLPEKKSPKITSMMILNGIEYLQDGDLSTKKKP